MSSIPELLRQQVFEEADYRCEYCRTSHRLVGMPPVIDHIIPQAAGGSDERENLMDRTRVASACRLKIYRVLHTIEGQ